MSGACLWHTLFGSNYDDSALGIGVTAGNVYVTGYSFGPWGLPLNARSGSSDIVTLKMYLSAVDFDINLDRQFDILWRHTPRGTNVVWTTNGAALAALDFLPNVSDANWEIVAP